MIEQLKAKTTAIAETAGRQAAAVSTGDTGTARSDARAAVETIARKFLEPEAGPKGDAPIAAGRLPAPGDRVVVGGLGLEAVVTSVHDGTADLDVRGKRMRASLRDLRIVDGAPTAPARINVNVELQPRDATPADLNVIGCTVDEAIARAERFLDESLLTDQRVVRFIHGYGTGQLKRALTGGVEGVGAAREPPLPAASRPYQP